MDEVKKQLEYIEEMMATAKENLAGGSIFYLLWGWLVLLAALSNYYLLEFAAFTNHWVTWPVLMSLGGILSIIAGMRLAKRSLVRTKIDRMLQHLWLGFFITLIVVLSAINVVGAEAIYPVLMALYGLGTFVSGSILNFRPLQIGAIVSWVCAIVAFHTDFANQLLLISAAIIFSYIVPGHLLALKK